MRHIFYMTNSKILLKIQRKVSRVKACTFEAIY